MRMASYIERSFLLSIPIIILFQFSTLTDLSKYIATEITESTSDKKSIEFTIDV